MKQVISENDYEKYKVYVPVKVFLNGRQRKYISSLLEKLHPCFSDNFCFDSKYRLSKKGICANVVVMDKLRLGEYKATYPGQTLTCNEGGETKVFVSKSKKIVLFSLICALLIADGFIVPVVKKLSTQKENLSLQSEIENQNKIADNKLLDNQFASISKDSFAYETFFDLFSENGGKVESLQWKYDGFTEQLSASAVNCYPEDFPYKEQTARFSNISYVDKVPSFSMNVTNRIVSKNDGMADLSASTGEDYRAKIRNVLKENSVNLLNENYLPYKIRFQVSEKNINEKLLTQIDEVSNHTGLCIKEIGVNICGKNLADVEICFTREFLYASEKSILSCLENGWQIFAMKRPSEKQNDINKSNTGIRVVAMGDEKLRKSGEQKIGTIIHADGEKVNFYKTAKGVIVNE